MQSCRLTMHHQALKTNLFCRNSQSFKEFSLSHCWKFQLAHLLRMIRQTHYVFYSIPVHEFLKHLVCKMAPSIANNSLGCPKSAQDISL